MGASDGTTLRALLRRRREGGAPVLIGVVHLLPTPGAPRYGGSLEVLLARARAEALALAEGGVDAVLLENFGDVPFFPERVPPETVASLAVALATAAEACTEAGRRLPLGVNVLRNDARAALGLCALGVASFFRVNVHAGAMVTDQGLLQGRAAATLRERARLAPDALLLADVHVKHATPLGAETLVEAATETFERAAADALVISGRRTGAPPVPAELAALRAALPSAPLLLGSGLDEAGAPELLEHADGALVGTALKRGGRLDEPVDPERVARLVARCAGLARNH